VRALDSTVDDCEVKKVVHPLVVPLFVRYLLFAIATAALLRWIAVSVVWELPSQIGTMILFAPFQACVARIAWQPYSTAKRLRTTLVLLWLVSMTMSVVVFVVWNLIFHDWSFNRKVVEVNAYHWITFFCMSWLGMRSVAAFATRLFSARFKPDPIGLMDLMIGLTLSAVLMSFFQAEVTGDWLGSRVVNRQLIHAIWGAVLFSFLWGILAWTISVRQYRVWIIMAVIIATTTARTISPYVNARIEGWFHDRVIILMPSDRPPFNGREGEVLYRAENYNDQMLFTERHFLRFPAFQERLVESCVQIGLILGMLLTIATKRVAFDTSPYDSSDLSSPETSLKESDSENQIVCLPNQL